MAGLHAEDSKLLRQFFSKRPVMSVRDVDATQTIDQVSAACLEPIGARSE